MNNNLINQLRMEVSTINEIFNDFDVKYNNLAKYSNQPSAFDLVSSVVSVSTNRGGGRDYGYVGIFIAHFFAWALCSGIFLIPIFIISAITVFYGFMNSTIITICFLLGAVLYSKYARPFLQKKGLGISLSSKEAAKELDKLMENTAKTLAQRLNGMNVLPVEYRYPIAANDVLNSLQQGRANSLPEALSLTDGYINNMMAQQTTKGAVDIQRSIALLSGKYSI